MPYENLTWRQEVFCQEFVKDYNATRAAQAAKYSKLTAPVIGAKNLKNAKILARIQEIQDAIVEDTQLDPTSMATPKELITSATRDLRFDFRNLFDDDNKPLPIKEIPDDTALSLTGLDIDERVVAGGDSIFSERVIQRKYKYKFPNKNQVRDSIARLMGLTNGNSEIIKAILEAVGLLQVNVQNNTYNIEVTEALRNVIECHESKGQ